MKKAFYLLLVASFYLSCGSSINSNLSVDEIYPDLWLQSKENKYLSSNLFDHDPATFFAFHNSRSRVHVKFNKKMKFDGIYIKNGAPGKLYAMNNRINKIEIRYGSEKITKKLEDTEQENYYAIDKPVEADEIDVVFYGEYIGKMYNDTCISELKFSFNKTPVKFANLENLRKIELKFIERNNREAYAGLKNHFTGMNLGLSKIEVMNKEKLFVFISGISSEGSLGIEGLLFSKNINNYRLECRYNFRNNALMDYQVFVSGKYENRHKEDFPENEHKEVLDLIKHMFGAELRENTGDKKLGTETFNVPGGRGYVRKNNAISELAGGTRTEMEVIVRKD